MWWVGLGMVIWGVMWVGVYSSSFVFVVVAWCMVLVLLGSRFILSLGAGCVSGGRLVLVGSLSCVTMWVGYERLRLMRRCGDGFGGGNWLGLVGLMLPVLFGASGGERCGYGVGRVGDVYMGCVVGRRV